MVIVKCYINNMQNKTTKEKKTETTPIAKLPHDTCDGCGETVKPDQWSKDIREQVFLCIDCA